MLIFSFLAQPFLIHLSEIFVEDECNPVTNLSSHVDTRVGDVTSLIINQLLQGYSVWINNYVRRIFAALRPQLILPRGRFKCLLLTKRIIQVRVFSSSC